MGTKKKKTKVILSKAKQHAIYNKTIISKETLI